jgi:hypothetical protein
MHAELHQRVLAAAAEVSTAERDGLWLIGVGAFLAAVSLLRQGSSGGLGGRPGGPAGTRADRIAFAIGLTGALSVALGSIDVAVEALPSLGLVVLTTVIAVVLIWLFAALRLHVDSRKNRDVSRRGAASGSALAPEREWDVKRYERHMHWRWCLANPFVSEAAAQRQAVEEFGKRPGIPNGDDGA